MEIGNEEWYLNEDNSEKLMSLLDRQAEYEATMKLLRSAEKLGMPEEIWHCNDINKEREEERQRAKAADKRWNALKEDSKDNLCMKDKN